MIRVPMEIGSGIGVAALDILDGKRRWNGASDEEPRSRVRTRSAVERWPRVLRHPDPIRPRWLRRLGRRPEDGAAAVRRPAGPEDAVRHERDLAAELVIEINGACNGAILAGINGNIPPEWQALNLRA